MNSSDGYGDKGNLQAEFFSRLGTLSKGERVALRRNAGKMIADADTGALCAFYRCLPYQVVRNEDRWFAAACFYNLWNPEDKGRRIPIQNALRTMRRAEQLSGSLEQRVASMLDTEWRSDGFLLTKLNRMMRMMRQQGYVIDCDSLLRDLVRWNYENRPAQREWVRVMYSTSNDEEQEIATEENNAN